VLRERLRAWLSRRRRGDGSDPGGEGTALFRARYHALRQLLAANNKALEVMAEMERAAAGGRLFGFSFVRSSCTDVGVSVFRMVSHLDAIAPGSYAELSAVLERIQHRIQAVLAGHRSSGDGALVLPLSAIDRGFSDSAGAKMANLGEVANVVGLPVPAGFVITAAAYQRLLDHNGLQPEIDRLIQSSEGDRAADLFGLASRLQQLLIGAEIPPELAAAIESAYEEVAAAVGGRLALAVRSSAIGEDSPEASFAGQYSSELNVRSEHLLDAYRQVVASKYTAQAMQYRLRRGLRDDEVAMCVGAIAMVEARAGGVAYTGNPGDAGDRRVFIHAAPGLPKAVVDGGLPSDLYVVSRAEPQRVEERHVARKQLQLVADPDEGVARVEIRKDARELPALSDAEAVEVAEAALRLEAHYGLPQDVEWAVDEQGRVVVLQCRPLHQLAARPRPAAPPDIGEPAVRGGVCVSPGAGAGPVCRVERDSDAMRFPDGAVLVVTHPVPRWAALLERAAAVLAREGGIAGHLATVARELGVPGVFAMPGLEALADGLEVTVDADSCAVYPGCVPELLEQTRSRPILMAGSPVHDSLLRAMAHITPLTLLDPDALSFRPSSCETLHDITRFCHETAVREMFEFGRRHRFPRHAAKQLHHNVPMQWWLLDLEDGFSREIAGRYVHLDEIACRPMLALWDGMVAVPWEGPPAMSGRGFASVLFEATANPALATPFRKPYAQRNYFMISRSFVNLQSRFGFHFAAVEALASERERENYLSFSFKGGAADMSRRSTRVRLVAEILEERGFTVTIVEDTVTARLAGLPKAEMEGRLREVGYLLMHTRQLDMAMADPAAVRYYGDKIRRDLSVLIGEANQQPEPGR
jgi:pyruvate,water dikinase